VYKHAISTVVPARNPRSNVPGGTHGPAGTAGAGFPVDDGDDEPQPNY
jgi:hypothetical protein